MTGAIAQANAGLLGGDTQYKFARVDTKIGVVGAHVGYYDFHDVASINSDSNIFAVGVTMPLFKDLTAEATYYRTDADQVNGQSVRKQGASAGLSYKGAKATKVGSYGLTAKYYDLAAGIALKHTMEGLYPSSDPATDGEVDGFKGWRITGNYTLAKNIVAMVGYYGIEGNKTGKHYDTLYSELKFLF